jgi:hypothetical protein
MIKFKKSKYIDVCIDIPEEDDTAFFCLSTRGAKETCKNNVEFAKDLRALADLIDQYPNHKITIWPRKK